MKKKFFTTQIVKNIMYGSSNIRINTVTERNENDRNTTIVQLYFANHITNNTVNASVNNKTNRVAHAIRTSINSVEIGVMGQCEERKSKALQGVPSRLHGAKSPALKEIIMEFQFLSHHFCKIQK